MNTQQQAARRQRPVDKPSSAQAASLSPVPTLNTASLAPRPAVSGIRQRLALMLRKTRARRHQSQHEAAVFLGLSLETYAKLELGECNATLQTLERLCERLKVDVRALFELP